MSEVTLVNIDGSAPEADEEAVSKAPQVEAQDVPEETPAPKKTRGRPPGAPNKPKAAPAPAPTPVPTPAPTPEPEPEPAPKRKKRVTVAPPPPKPRRPTVAPDSPKTVYSKILVQRNQARVDRHTAKIQGYSSLLDQMLSY